MPIALASSDRPRPFPLPGDRAAEMARSVHRACTAALLSEIRTPGQSRGEGVLRDTWPGDHRAAAIIGRAASSPATTSTTGWAAELAPVNTTAGAFLSSLAQSGAARLFSAGLVLPLAGTASIRIPFASATPSLAPSAVVEGAPIPVRQAAFSTLTLSPKKLACITTMSAEIGEYSTPAAELIVRQVMTETAARALDLAVFTSSTGGIMNGVSGLTPTAGGGEAAFAGDIKQLLDALTTAGAGTRIMVFASPSVAARIAFYAPAYVPTVEIIPTPVLAPSTILVVDPNGVVSASGTDQPRIDIARETTVHLEDTTPLQISSGAQGSGVLATPVRNMYQSDSVAIRLLLVTGWAARPGWLQYVAGITW